MCLKPVLCRHRAYRNARQQQRVDLAPELVIPHWIVQFTARLAIRHEQHDHAVGPQHLRGDPPQRLRLGKMFEHVAGKEAVNSVRHA